MESMKYTPMSLKSFSLTEKKERRDISYTVGITGGIGTGKSIISRILRCNGFEVYDCDYEAKKIMVNDFDVRKNLKKGLGDYIYFPDGSLNRSKLAKYLFSDQNIRDYVNKIVHAAVRRHIMRRRTEIKGYMFIESAILSTGGISPLCDEIWIITASEYERIERIKKRDKISIEEIMKRFKTQEREIKNLKEEKKILFIENDSFHSVLPYVLSLTNRIKNNQAYLISC